MLIEALVLQLVCSITVSENVKLHGNCSDDQGPMEITGRDRGPLFCRLWDTGSCSNNELPHQVDGEFLAAPDDVSVTTEFTESGGRGQVANLVVTIKPPITSVGIFKGFYLELHKLTGGGGKMFQCIVLDFSNNSFTTQDYKLIFKKSIPDLVPGPDHIYQLDVYTLPRSPQSKPKTCTVSVDIPPDFNNTANWISQISSPVTLSSNPANVTFTFSLAPKYFKFTSYLLQLVDYSGTTPSVFLACNVNIKDGYVCQNVRHSHADKDSTNITHTFYDVPTGQYTIWVTPEPDDVQWDMTSCRCFILQASDRWRNCQPCGFTPSQPITIEAAAPPRSASPPIPSPSSDTTVDAHISTIQAFTAHISTYHAFTAHKSLIAEPVKQASSNSNVIMVVSVTLATLLGMLVIGVAVFLRLKKHNAKYSLKQEQISKFSKRGITHKSICLLAARDHPHHLTAVKLMAELLEEWCCDVTIIPSCQMTQPLPGDDVPTSPRGHAYPTSIQNQFPQGNNNPTSSQNQFPQGHDHPASPKYQFPQGHDYPTSYQNQFPQGHDYSMSSQNQFPQGHDDPTSPKYQFPQGHDYRTSSKNQFPQGHDHPTSPKYQFLQGHDYSTSYQHQYPQGHDYRTSSQNQFPQGHNYPTSSQNQFPQGHDYHMSSQHQPYNCQISRGDDLYVLDKVDKVVLVSSEAAFRFCNDLGSGSYRGVADQHRDTFSSAYSHLMAKAGQPKFFRDTIFTSFDYTSEDVLVNDLTPAAQYRLPQHINQFLSHVHDLNPLGSESLNALDSSAGRRLVDAITKAKNYEKTNPDWFDRSFTLVGAESVSNSVFTDKRFIGVCLTTTDVGSCDGAPDTVDCGGRSKLEGSGIYSICSDSCVTYTTDMGAKPNWEFPYPPSDVVSTTTEDINRQLLNINVNSAML